MPALIIAFLAVAIHLSPTMTNALQWTRGGEHFSTLWTAHLTHWSAGHLFWDALMLAVFGLIAARSYGLRLLTTFLLTAPLITIGVAYFSPEITSYRGLSGLDTLLFTYVCLKILCDAKQTQSMRIASVLMMLGLTGKTAYETMTHSALFAGDLGPGVVTVPVAHLIGGLLGAALAVGSLTRKPLKGAAASALPN
ncbi:rhomboid family intramembrane serine protease [Cerasicoccus frondis]|uniref:rhomboid family intramembrane serine protease n=1 Tax=Cerasicoccus frondis TaxID=490090 RepID=UPI002852C793|nr:rhomboid family intramembrane serine protease [Cerasicoccus frondis]